LKREALILPVRKDSSPGLLRTAALALAVALTFACARASSDPAAAPSFANLDQLESEIAKFRGHGLLLNLWATWCAPCVAELPELIETAHASESRGGAVLLLSFDLMVPGVTREDARQKVGEFVSRKKIDVPGLIFDADGYDAINARFDLPGEVPVTLAFDRNGKVVDRQEGRADKARFAEMMERALAP
jgi:thiol-disulfide isomerase/thioredoxin